jgi:hypothetical protein
MPTQDTTPSRRIVFSGLGAEAPASERAISLVDEAGKRLDRASVNEDDSCELLEEALASAYWVIFEPINVLVEADQFRTLIDAEEPVDVTGLLEAGVQVSSWREDNWNNRGMDPEPEHYPGGRGWG